MLEGLGFRALATTSSGFAYTLGRLDGGVTLDEVAEHVRALAAATGLPISVDLENGYGPDPEHAATAIARAAEAGAVGGSIEDFDRGGELYSLEHATERVAAARRGGARARLPVHADRPGGEPHPRGPGHRRHDRAPAGLRAGRAPTCCSRPGCAASTRSAPWPKPSRSRSTCSPTGASPCAEIAEAGGQRVSVGGGLAFVGVGAFVAAAEQIRDGDFSALGARLALDQWLGE